MVNFGPVALFSEAKLTTSSGKHSEKVDNLHPISLIYKLLTSNQQTSQLMYGFEESQATRRQELTNNKTEKGTFFVRIKLKDLFGFADQEKITYGLGYSLTLKRNNNNDPIIRDNGVDAAKINIKDISWHIPHYTPSMENQQLVMDQILDKDPTELYYIERVVFRKDVNTNNNLTFELGNSGESTPSFIIVGFQVRNKIDSQTHDNAIFDRLPISNAVCKINPFIDLHEFRTNNNFYVFDLSKQRDPIGSQPIRLEFKFNAAINVADYIAYALVLTPKLISISSDGQRHFDLL